jgi:hypothetical protein
MHVYLISPLVTGNLLNTNNGINKVTTDSGINKKFDKRSEINMGFGKSFGLGLLVYILLNLGMSVVVAAINNPASIGTMFTSIDLILLAMLAPVLSGATAFVAFGSSAFDLAMIFEALLLILPGLIGALVAGKSSDSAKAAFGGWLLAPIITAVILVVLVFAMPTIVGASSALTGLQYMLGLTGGMLELYIILSGVTVGFLWGGIAAIMAGP